MATQMSWKCRLAAALMLSAPFLAGCNSAPCGGSGDACCGAGVCNSPLVCVAGTCGPNTMTAPKTQSDICQLLAEGQARRDALNQLSAQVPLFSAVASSACDATVDQQLAVQTLRQQLVAAVVAPIQSMACADPKSQLSQRAARVAVGLDAGRIVWNGPAEAECELGMQSSQYLTSAVLSADGGFAGVSQVFGPSGKQGSAPCDELLQGQVTLGQSCQDGAECQPGLYCRPASATGCGGVCAVPDGGCGPLELCSGQAVPYVSLGGGLQTSLPIGTPCDAGAGCGPCEACVGNRCAAGLGVLGSPCPGSGCLAPLLFCDDSNTCESSHVLGAACVPGIGVCLQGSCLGSPATCSPPGGLGDACDLSLAPAACDAGVCAPGSGGGAVCQPFPDAGQPCVQSQCGPGAVCDPDSTTCQAPGAGGQACSVNTQCESGFCVVPDGGSPDAGACLSPCIQPPDSGCLNLYSNSSFLLGLGGAMILGRRQRRLRRAREARPARLA